MQPTTTRLSPAERQCDHCRGLGYSGNISCDYCFNGVAYCACGSSAVLAPDADGEVRCGACARAYEESFCVVCGQFEAIDAPGGIPHCDKCLKTPVSKADDVGLQAARAS